MSRERKPSPVLTEILSKITDEDREKTLKEMFKEIEECDDIRNRKVEHTLLSKRHRVKLTEEVIVDLLKWRDDVIRGVDDDGTEIVVHFYKSPCGRFELTRDPYSNIALDCDGGWSLHIDNSDMSSIGHVSVNYVNEVYDIIDIFKEY